MIWKCTMPLQQWLWPRLKQPCGRGSEDGSTDTMMRRPPLYRVETPSLTHISSFLSQSPSWWCHILSGTTAIVLPRKWTSCGRSVLPSEGQSVHSGTAVQQEESLWRLINMTLLCECNAYYCVFTPAQVIQSRGVYFSFHDAIHTYIYKYKNTAVQFLIIR